VHRDRRRRTDELRQLASEENWEELYRRLMLWEFPHEARMGWQLAFLRPFAVPRMASTLVKAGHLVDNPLKRAYDTGLIIYEIVYGGVNSPRGRQMISVMNRAHHGRNILDEDMTYVLCAFIVAPMRYIDHAGWRPLSTAERRSSLEFYTAMGRIMNIRDIPVSYADAERVFDDYERANVRASGDAQVLGRNLLAVLKGRLPAVARPLAGPLFATQLNDARIAAALGIRTPTPALQTVANGVAHLHGLIQRQLSPATTPVFTPGMKAGRLYPTGYQLEQLGPPSSVNDAATGAAKADSGPRVPPNSSNQHIDIV